MTGEALEMVRIAQSPHELPSEVATAFPTDTRRARSSAATAIRSDQVLGWQRRVGRILGL